MQAGNIVKVTEQFNIHKTGTLGVLVNSELNRHSSNSDSLSVLFEDGHFIAVTEDAPLQNIGYNQAFNKANEQFKSLRLKVKEQGRSVFVKKANCSEIAIVLTDDADRKTCFSVGFNESGKFYESNSTYEGDVEGTRTVNAFIGEINIDIDGNAWRDLEAGDYMEDFVSNVVYGDRDAEEFFVNIAEALGTSDQPGIVF